MTPERPRGPFVNSPLRTPRRREVLTQLAASPLLVWGAGLGAGLGGAAAPGTASAQAAASPPMRILVGASPGGSTDTLAREIAPEMGRLLGRTVIVENRAGAGGNLAADAVAKAAPDGNTLLLSFTSHTINATLYPKLPFDPVSDFTPLTMIATSPSVLVAHPSLPVKDVKELIAYAKPRPGQLNFAIGGIGSSLHLAGEAFKLKAGLFIVNIPYRGTAPAVADVVAGNVPLMFANVGNVRSLVQAGRLKALGVTSPRRLPQFPDAPAIAEVLPGFESNAWFGLFGPAKMPPELVARINAALVQVLNSPEVREFYARGAWETSPGSPADLAQDMRVAYDRWGAMIRAIGFEKQ